MKPKVKAKYPHHHHGPLLYVCTCVARGEAPVAIVDLEDQFIFCDNHFPPEPTDDDIAVCSISFAREEGIAVVGGRIAHPQRLPGVPPSAYQRFKKLQIQ